MVQDINDWFAGDPDQAAKRMVEFQNQEKSAGDGKRGSDQGKSSRVVRRRDQAKAKEDDYEP